MKLLHLILLLSFLLLIINMRKKYCKTIKGRKKCTNFKPQMNARQIISLQMNSLQDNNMNDSGIRIAFKYASRENKKMTGPYNKFNKMVKNNTYKHLLNCISWRFVPNTIRKKNDEIYSSVVEVLSSYDNQKYQYRFTLSRQPNNLFWRTDSVILQGKEYYNNSKNVYDQNLEICGLDPITGYHRKGYCTTDDSDHGTHTVCGIMTDNFLNYTKSKGNDLTTKRGSFPGLKRGDRWCLCSSRWNEAMKDGYAPKVDLNATHSKTLETINISDLERFNYQ